MLNHDHAPNHYHAHYDTNRRSLAYLSQQIGSDPSWGLYNLLKKTQDISVVELESTENLLLSPPEATR